MQARGHLCAAGIKGVIQGVGGQHGGICARTLMVQAAVLCAQVQARSNRLCADAGLTLLHLARAVRRAVQHGLRVG